MDFFCNDNDRKPRLMSYWSWMVRENLEILSKSGQVNLFLAFKEKSFWGSYFETGKTISEGKYKDIDIKKGLNS